MTQVVAKSIVYLLWSYGAVSLSFVLCLFIPRVSYGDTTGTCPHIAGCSVFQELYLGLIFMFASLIAGPKCRSFNILVFVCVILFSQAYEWRFGHGLVDTLKTIPIDPLVYGGLLGLLVYQLTWQK